MATKRFGIPYAFIHESGKAHICPECQEVIPAMGKGKDRETLSLENYRAHLSERHDIP